MEPGPGPQDTMEGGEGAEGTAEAGTEHTEEIETRTRHTEETIKYLAETEKPPKHPSDTFATLQEVGSIGLTWPLGIVLSFLIILNIEISNCVVLSLSLSL